MFWEKSKKTKEAKEKPEEFGSVDVEKDDEANPRHIDTSPALGRAEARPGKFRNFEFGVLKGFYVSEKASWLNSFNQYVFKVFGNTTKNEVKKQVEKSFDVKVKDVKIINLPRKRRNVGRHSGFRPGFKKAIVVLKEGYGIEQAKP